MKKQMKKWGVKTKLSVLALSALLSLGTAVPVMADGGTSVPASTATSEAHKYTITFNLEDGSSKTFYANEGDTYGPEGTISVRDTYYDAASDRDYDLASGSVPETSAPIEGDMSFTYQYAKTPSYSVSVRCIVKGNGDEETVLKTFSGEVTSENPTVSFEIPETFDNGKYTTDQAGTVTFDYNNIDTENLQKDIVYTAVKDEEDSSFEATVYYKEGDKVLETRTFYVKNDSSVFYAPSVFRKDGTFYKAADTKATKITKKDVDNDSHSCTVSYTSGSYVWNIVACDSRTGNPIEGGTSQVTEDAGSTATFTPAEKIGNYTLNSVFLKDGKPAEMTHSSSDPETTTYIYYDPEGYSFDPTNAPVRYVSVRYIDIARADETNSRNGQIQADLSVPVSQADGNEGTRIDFPDSLDVNGVHYVRVDGQPSYIMHNYYSPKNLYMVFYRDEANKDFEHVTLTTVENVETEVTTGGTTYTILPGITRYVTVNQDNGQETTVATTDSQGNPVTQGTAGTASDAAAGTASGNDANGTAEGTEGSDAGNAAGNASTDNSSDEEQQNISIDGVQADQIQTPQGNIQLNKTGKPIGGIIAGCLAAAAAAIIILALLIFRRSRKDNVHGH